jgi:hypothetical protein
MEKQSKGKCTKCNEDISPTKAADHCLKCILQSPAPSQLENAYLMRISWGELLNLYWMYLAITKETSLEQLDRFLRNTWLECCGHLSKFTIAGHRYMSHTESGRPSPSMKTKIDQLVTPGSIFAYTYDMGSSTNLELEVIEAIAISSKKIAILMRNNPPCFFCEICENPAEVICSICGDRTCSDCIEEHSCVVEEGDTYMLMPLANSPRAGVCGYTGSKQLSTKVESFMVHTMCPH